MYLGNLLLDQLDFSELKNKVICQDHFANDQFMNLSDKILKLKPFAVPNKYNLDGNYNKNI